MDRNYPSIRLSEGPVPAGAQGTAGQPAPPAPDLAERGDIVLKTLPAGDLEVVML